jgi:hypothetical protein
MNDREDPAYVTGGPQNGALGPSAFGCITILDHSRLVAKGLPKPPAGGSDSLWPQNAIPEKHAFPFSAGLALAILTVRPAPPFRRNVRIRTSALRMP